MAVFEYLVMFVFLYTVGRIFSRRRSMPLPRESFQLDAEELHRLRDTISDLSTRMERLEEERDFYKDLLDPPRDRGVLPPSDSDL